MACRICRIWGSSSSRSARRNLRPTRQWKWESCQKGHPGHAELHHNWDGSQYFEPWHAQIQYYRFNHLSHTIQILVRILTISGNLLNFKWELQECLCSWRGGVNPEHRTQKQHCSSCSIQLNTFSINHFNPWFCNLYGMFLQVCVAFSSR